MLNNHPALSPWIIIGVFALYGLLHSLLASLTAKQSLERRFGENAKRYYRIAYNIFSTLSLLPVMALPVLLPDRPWYSIPAPWMGLSFVIQIISGFLLVLSVIQAGIWSFLGINQVLGIKMEEGLYTGGLYRYMRHPLYTFSMIFLWATPVMTYNIAAFCFSISAYFVIGAVYEERKMAVVFGEEYTRYQSQTPMFVPISWGRPQDR